MAGKWIAKALSNPGSKGKLHRALGVPAGQKIPASKMKAKGHGAAVKKEIALAKTLSKFH